MSTVTINMTAEDHAALVEAINSGALLDYRKRLAAEINHKELSALLGARFHPAAIAKFARIAQQLRGLDGASAAILADR